MDWLIEWKWMKNTGCCNKFHAGSNHLAGGTLSKITNAIYFRREFWLKMKKTSARLNWFGFIVTKSHCQCENEHKTERFWSFIDTKSRKNNQTKPNKSNTSKCGYLQWKQNTKSTIHICSYANAKIQRHLLILPDTHA